ncbi:MAG TPA: tetratricopeptide repeat protein [Gammaproteobacteria bacterium]|nr:tetratricopeptide repeat protein [Gammaproteobacteria bacterium]
MKVTAALLVLAAVAHPFGARAERAAVLGRAATGAPARERELSERIEQERSLHGPRSERLIGPLNALGLLYEEDGDHALAITAFEQARQLVRVHYGLYSLEEAPLLQRLVENAAAAGDSASAWALEKQLMGLVDRHPNDPRTVPILRGVADRRMDVLSRYIAGDFPPEIVLGCYYNAGETPTPDPWGYGFGSIGSCHAGSRSVVIRSLLAEAHSYYTRALDTLVRNQGYSSDELPDFSRQLVRIGYQYADYSLAADGLRHLARYESEHATSPAGRTHAEIQLIDWKVLLYRVSHGYSGRYAPVLEQYEQAYERLSQEGAEPASIEQIFSPAMPVVLPAFMPNPLVSEETPESTGYIDVAFEINEYGRAEHIEVLGAENAARGAERRLVHLIKGSLFRPRIVDGRIDDDSRVVLRYYLNGDGVPSGVDRGPSDGDERASAADDAGAQRDPSS